AGADAKGGGARGPAKPSGLSAAAADRPVRPAPTMAISALVSLPVAATILCLFCGLPRSRALMLVPVAKSPSIKPLTTESLVAKCPIIQVTTRLLSWLLRHVLDGKLGLMLIACLPLVNECDKPCRTRTGGP